MVIDYDKIIDETIEFNKKYTIVVGQVDVLKDKNYKSFYIKEFTKDSYWVLSGYDNFEIIQDAFIDHEFINIDREGSYEFKSVLLYDKGEYDEYGRSYTKGYLYIEYIKWEFIQSFESRDREIKLNELGIDDIFNI